MRCAQQWIDIVEARTGHEVAIYTNQSWWDSVIGNAGKPLAKDQPIWISRYPGGGPAHLPSWTAKGGSPKWKMPPLPIGAGYPATTYTVGHFWQFGEEAGLSAPTFTCGSQTLIKDAELNWSPVTGAAFKSSFGLD